MVDCFVYSPTTCNFYWLPFFRRGDAKLLKPLPYWVGRRQRNMDRRCFIDVAVRSWWRWGRFLWWWWVILVWWKYWRKGGWSFIICVGVQDQFYQEKWDRWWSTWCVKISAIVFIHNTTYTRPLKMIDVWVELKLNWCVSIQYEIYSGVGSHNLVRCHVLAYGMITVLEKVTSTNIVNV